MDFVRTSSVRSSMTKKRVVDPTDEFRAQNKTDGMSMMYLHWYTTDGMSMMYLHWYTTGGMSMMYLHWYTTGGMSMMYLHWYTTDGMSMMYLHWYTTGGTVPWLHHCCHGYCALIDFVSMGRKWGWGGDGGWGGDSDV